MTTMPEMYYQSVKSLQYAYGRVIIMIGGRLESSTLN